MMQQTSKKDSSLKQLAFALGLTLAAGLSVANTGAQDARELFFNPTKAIFGSSTSGTVITSNEKPGEGFTPEDSGRLGVSNADGLWEQLENPGLSYTVELKRPGNPQIKQVSVNHVFKAGDRIRVHVSSNGDGYLHALHQGSSGNYLVVPTSGAGGRVMNGQNIAIPSKTGWLKFDKRKGIEKLDILFSDHASAARNGLVPNPGIEGEALIQNIRHAVSQYSAHKDLLVYESPTKDLVIENGSGVHRPSAIPRKTQTAISVQPAVYNAPATYAVSRSGNPVAVRLNLNHQ